jgi:hypothetical protein
MGWVVLVLLVVAVLCMAAQLLTRHRSPVTSGLTAPPPAVPGPYPAPPPDRYLVLMQMLRGDRAEADRLIAFEADKAPEASRARWIEYAVERLRRDLGR